MRVVILNTYDVEGGAARSGVRLNRTLNNRGIFSRIIVQRKVSDDFTIIGPRNSRDTIEEIVRPHLDVFPLRFYPNRQKYLFSPSILPDRLPSKVDEFKPDLIHLNWVCAGFMRIETLRKFS